MQFHRQRDLGIEVVSAPLPTGLPNHRRQVVERKTVESLEGLIADGRHRIPCLQHVLLPEQEVDVVLGAQLRRRNKPRAQAETLQYGELEAPGPESRGASQYVFLTRRQRSALPARFGRSAAATQSGSSLRHRKPNGSVTCAWSAEIQNPLPVLVRQPAQRRRAAIGKAQRLDGRRGRAAAVGRVRRIRNRISNRTGIAADRRPKTPCRRTDRSPDTGRECRNSGGSEH